jgi:hydroxymethylpyrimidine kinase/phosphomethylpyrimidine kinase
MIKRVLTIAGSDSSGGAGIQADLKTFSAFQVYGMSVVTAVTAQNTIRVYGVEGMPPQFVALQFEAILSDIGVDGVKTGMLVNSEIVQIVANKFRGSKIPYIVVDPVMVAKSGDQLLEPLALEFMKNDLFPFTSLVTPNIPEAELLSDITIESEDDIKRAAKIIYNYGCGAVLIKGGHMSGNADDFLFDGDGFTIFTSERIDTKNTHGTGCTFSAAILANLVNGKSLKEAIKISKTYITEAIRHAHRLGKGHGPLNHKIIDNSNLIK